QGRLALRGVKIDAGALSASGTIDVDGAKSIAGRIAADMKTPGGAMRASLVVSGSPSPLHVKRGKAGPLGRRAGGAGIIRAYRRAAHADPPLARERGTLRVPPREARDRSPGPPSKSRRRRRRVLALRRARVRA